MPRERKRGVTSKPEHPAKKRKVYHRNKSARIIQTPARARTIGDRRKHSKESDSSIEPVRIRLEKAINSFNNYSAIQILTSSHANDYCSKKLRNDALLRACFQGMLPTVRTLIEDGAVLNKKNTTNGTPLNAAVENGFPDLVKYLIEKGADVNQTSLYGDTALMLSIKKQYSIALSQDLINAGADVDARNKFGKTAAMLAIEKYDLKTFMLLVESGANLKLTNASGKTAFDLASDFNILETVKLISEHKSDINSIVNKAKNNNQLDVLKDFMKCGISLVLDEQNNESVSEFPEQPTTSEPQDMDLNGKDGDLDDSNHDSNVTAKTSTPPLCLAAASGKLDVAKMLISAGCDVNVRETAEIMTPMMLAASNGHQDMIKLLHKSGADVNAVGKSSYTALTYAVNAKHVPCVKTLLKLGATVNKRQDFVISSLQDELVCLKLLSKHADMADLDTDVLLAAVRGSNYKAVKFLLSKGMDVNALTFSGEPIILQSRDKKMAQLMIKNGALVNNLGSLFTGEDDDEDMEAKEEILPLLIKHGANFNEKSYMNHSPLISATIRNRTSVVQMLLDGGADPDGVSTQKQTALMFAAQRDYIDIIRCLINKGASVDAQDRSGMSALMFAAINSCLDSVQLLLEKGARVDLEDSMGNTALMLSTSDEVVKTLVAYGAEVNRHNKKGLTPLRLSKTSKRFSLQKTLEDLGAVSD